MKIFVTGATGFVGQHLVKRLLEQGNNVVALCRDSSKLQPLLSENLKIIKGDLSNS